MVIPSVVTVIAWPRRSWIACPWMRHHHRRHCYDHRSDHSNDHHRHHHHHHWSTYRMSYW